MSITSAAYSEHFGFTSQDVETLLKAYGLEKNMPIVKQWYDGYCFGNTEVYNPWSVINYIDSCYHDKNALAKPYWSNTSSYSIVKNLVEHADLSVKQEIETLIEGKTIYMEMSIPNSEVRYIYKNTVLRWFEEQNQKKALEPLYESILDGDTKTMANILSENLMETISFYDYQENYYHGFLTGLLKGMKNYQELEKKCVEALTQIHQRHYAAPLLQEGYANILLYGVAFYKKDCMVMKDCMSTAGETSRSDH